jgi:hypothetical protein
MGILFDRNLPTAKMQITPQDYPKVKAQGSAEEQDELKQSFSSSCS